MLLDRAVRLSSRTDQGLWLGKLVRQGWKLCSTAGGAATGVGTLPERNCRMGSVVPEITGQDSQTGAAGSCGGST